MYEVDLTSISAQQVKVFIAAGESENFTMTAKKLSVTEPLVSRTITDLETKLGFLLFTRGKRKIKLTPAGEALLEDWKHFYAFLNTSVEKAYQIHMRSQGAFTIGFSTTFDEQARKKISQCISQSDIGLQYKFEQQSPALLEKLVELGKIDIGFVPATISKRVNEAEINQMIVYKDCGYIDVPQSFEFYKSNQVTVRELIDVPIMLVNPSTDNGYNNDVMTLLAKHEVTPKIHSYADNYEALLASRGYVDAGVVISGFSPLSNQKTIKRIPIIDTVADIVAIWNDNSEKNIKDVLSLLTDFSLR